MSEDNKGQGLRFGAIVTLVPIVTAAFGGLQYFRDQQQREFEAVTFYLQNQSTFDPCQDAQLANLNLGMIENIYPKVYARVVDHVENRASQCDSVAVLSQEQIAAAPPAVQAPAAPAPNTGDAPAASNNAPAQAQVQAPAIVLPRQTRANIPANAQQATDFFRNRYDRMASLPTSSARRVKEGEYRLLIQISDEADRALAQSIEAALRDSGATTPSIDLVPVRVEQAELRYFREAQAADAQKLAEQIKQTLAAAGAPADVTVSFVGRAGLPPGVMELWLP